MVDVVLHGAMVRGHCIVLTKMKVMNLCLFLLFEDIVNAIFLKYSKEGTLSSSYVGNRNIPSDVCHDVTKHYQVQSEHRRTQNPFQHLRWIVFAQTVNTLNSFTGCAKNSVLDVWMGSGYASAAKQGRCKVCRKNSWRRYVKYKSTWCVFWKIWMILASVWLRSVRLEN